MFGAARKREPRQYAATGAASLLCEETIQARNLADDSATISAALLRRAIDAAWTILLTAPWLFGNICQFIDVVGILRALEQSADHLVGSGNLREAAHFARALHIGFLQSAAREGNRRRSNVRRRIVGPE